MENLPEDVLSNIFIRLRAKQLAQIRCICKSWNALLSQSYFVKSHLHHSVHNNDGILLVCPSKPFKITAHPSRSPHPELANFIKHLAKPQFKNGNGRVIGSVNGLICFEYGSNQDSKFIYIWNPSLSAVITLPPCSVSSHFDKCTTDTDNLFRFGYYPETDDYKVVKLTQVFNLASFSVTWLQVEVYSMRKGSWELITEKVPSHLTWMLDQDSICLDGHDGHLHWLGHIRLGWNYLETIVAFDLGAETFCEIPLPDSIRDDKVHNVLGILARKLCVMSRAPQVDVWEVWVMDEYGVAESWVKHHVFPPFSYAINPYGFTSHHEFLFQVYSHSLALYDPVAAMTKIFKLDGEYNFAIKVVEYVDSLVWVTPAKEREISY